MSNENHFMDKVEASALYTIIGVILLFSCAVIVTLIAPSYVDPSWTSPTSPYQVQMYEVADPNIYISNSSNGERQVIRHLKKGFSLLAFQEDELTKIIASPNLEKFITHASDKELKLTSNLLMLRKPKNSESFKAQEIAAKIKKELMETWSKSHPKAEIDSQPRPDYIILELFEHANDSAFAVSNTDSILENWVDKDFILLNPPQEDYHKDSGVIYVLNPQEFKVSKNMQGDKVLWHYNPEGIALKNDHEIHGQPYGFLSRQELILMGENIYKIEGCWYCHTDQTRTLIQDVVLNGSEAYPAPPSSANEYIYQNFTFAGTRRIGPDLSRVGVKRPGRDWHKGHFWSPKTASAGSIMPSFQHFFDNDPRGTGTRSVNLPNSQFEAIYQYLMTKGTRITPPTQAWWIGKDPIKTKEIIDGLRTLKE